MSRVVVTRFRPGDQVLGDLCGCGFGAFAQYACAAESALTAMPGFLSFEQAAAVPQAAGLAIAGLAKGGPLRPGQRVLMNEGGGGVGTFAIQIAKASGVEVPQRSVHRQDHHHDVKQAPDAGQLATRLRAQPAGTRAAAVVMA